MPTANEEIRDALIKRQIVLIKQGNAASREIVKLLEEAHGDLKRRIDARLRRVRRAGNDTGPETTKRLLALERNIRQILGKSYRRIDKRFRAIMIEIGLNDPRIVARIMKDLIPVVVSFTVPSAKQLRAIVETMPVDGTPLGEIFKRMTDIVTDGLMSAIRRGLALGESLQVIARRLIKQFDLTRTRAKAMVRTAANAAANRARQEMLRENADVIQWVVWISTLDDRTCPFCGYQDGRRYKIDKGPRPPAHINCRCTTVGTIDGKLIGERPLKRSTQEDLLAEYAAQAGIKPVKSRTSLPRGHKGKFDAFARKRVSQMAGRTPASVTFDEFLRDQSPAFQNRVLRKQVAEWYRQRRVDLEDLFDDDGVILSIDEIMRRRPDLRDAA